ncbi:MAG: ATP-binding protein [Bacillota bacterium]
MMKGRLFTKLMLTYTAVIVAVLTVLGFLLPFLLNNYFIYNKKTELIVKGSNIVNLIRPLLVEKRDPAMLVNLLNSADRNMGAEVWIIDRNGSVITASANHLRHEGDTLEPRDIENLRQGKTSIREGESQFYNEKVLWAVLPVQNRGEVIGGVILYSPVMGISLTMAKVKNLFIYSAVVSIIFASLIAYFFSRSVSRPLQEMNLVAHRVAEGRFDERVDVCSGDEIGQLGHSFNFMAGQIERHEKMRREFVANVSHELRSPLTSVQGFIEALMDGKDKTPEDRKRYLDIVHTETMRLIRLVNELLDLSRVEEGIVRLKLKEVDLAGVIDNVLKKYRPVLEERSIRVIKKLPPSLPELKGDGDRIQQVLNNLLDNAIRYSENDTEIVIAVEDSAGNVKITVEDHGKGIPEEELPYVWDRFYKVDKARSRNAEGTGLGLAIARQIVEQHGGRVEAESIPLQGSKFSFSLPMYKSPTR